MDLKERTQKELESRIKDLEQLIARKGVGSGYLAKMERIQRNVNILLFLGITTTVVGLTTWMILKNRDSDEEEED